MEVVRGGPKLHWERRGRGEPLLWITGFTISAAVFEPVLPLYEDHFDCLTFDNRGAGRSDSPLTPTSMPELAADCVRVLDAAGVGAAHVFGISMGGMVAQELALRFPERVRGLVLGATTPGGPQAAWPTLRELGALGVGAAGAARLPGRAWLAGWLFSPEFRREQPERAAELVRVFRRHRARPQGIASHLLATAYHDTVSRLDRIQAPTLVVHGAKDRMAPLSNARLLARAIPDAELAIVEGAGHAYPLEQPERSRDLLVDWIGRRSPIAPGRPRHRLVASTEPLTRPFGLQIGALRTGLSLAARAAGRVPGPVPPRDTPSG